MRITPSMIVYTHIHTQFHVLADEVLCVQLSIASQVMFERLWLKGYSKLNTNL